jgi:small subunit ribosomal protein S2
MSSGFGTIKVNGKVKGVGKASKDSDNANDIIDSKTEDENQESGFRASNINIIEEMYRAGVHFGYPRRLRHPKMDPYLYGLRDGVEVFNLSQTYNCLLAAQRFLKDLAASGGDVLFVATKPEAQEIVEKAARDTGMPFVVGKWIGGLLTNFQVVRKQIDYFEELCEKKSGGEFSSLSKKEAFRLEKKLLKLEKNLGGIRLMKKLPSALLVVDSIEEKVAVSEARKAGIPVIGILNSDCNPLEVDYPIPANDSAPRSIQFIMDQLVKAYKEGLKERTGSVSTHLGAEDDNVVVGKNQQGDS